MRPPRTLITSSWGRKIWNVLAQRGGQIDLVILLINKNLANLFGHCKLP